MTHPFPFSRRSFLQHNAMGLGSVVLAWLMRQDAACAVPPVIRQKAVTDLKPRVPGKAPQARAMISLFQHGGPSHMDLTDPKPELTKYSGSDYPGDVQFSFVNEASKKLLGSPFKFRPHGQCGTEISELLPHTASIVDDICLIRSMHTGANGHEVSIRYFHGGIPAVLGRPHFASWLLYALGSETQDLPAYMVMTDPGGPPVDGANNWSNGFMPPLFQGTVLRPREPRILNLAAPSYLQGTLQQQNLAFLQKLNARHLELNGGDSDLEARIASYELAARMQSAATDVLDISQETRATQTLYGLDNEATREYGTRCLIARRLVERGVRFIQLFLGGQPLGQPQCHSDIAARRLSASGSACGGISERPETARYAGFDDRPLGRRNRTSACHSGSGRSCCGGTRPQRPGFQHLAGRWRYQGRNDVRDHRRIWSSRR